MQPTHIIPPNLTLHTCNLHTSYPLTLITLHTCNLHTTPNLTCNPHTTCMKLGTRELYQPIQSCHVFCLGISNKSVAVPRQDSICRAHAVQSGYCNIHMYKSYNNHQYIVMYMQMVQIPHHYKLAHSDHDGLLLDPPGVGGEGTTATLISSIFNGWYVEGEREAGRIHVCG